MEEIKTGRIIHIISNLFLVEIEGEVLECTSRGIFKNKEEKPVVGDLVKVNLSHDLNSIIQIVDRKQYCKRPKMANLTQLICVVSAKHPKPDLLMLDKQLVFAEYLGVKPVIIVTKRDLDEAEAKRIKEVYSKIGYQVITSNAKDVAFDNTEIKKILEGNISAFSGNSGVGKSTLINGILEDTVTEEGEVSHKNKKGKNTTTSVKLYKLGANTYIADTPGFSTFDVFEIPYKELYHYFKEFPQYVKECEYQDCTHIKEEMCGIKQQVGTTIEESRYHNFIKIYEELKDREDHKW